MDKKNHDPFYAVYIKHLKYNNKDSWKKIMKKYAMQTFF